MQALRMSKLWRPCNCVEVVHLECLWSQTGKMRPVAGLEKVESLHDEVVALKSCMLFTSQYGGQ